MGIVIFKLKIIYWLLIISTDPVFKDLQGAQGLLFSKGVPISAERNCVQNVCVKMLTVQSRMMQV